MPDPTCGEHGWLASSDGEVPHTHTSPTDRLQMEDGFTCCCWHFVNTTLKKA